MLVGSVAMEAGAANVEAIADQTCSAFERASAPPGSIHRFLVGRDPSPQEMDQDEIERELNDPFATLLLRQARFPATPEAVFAALDEVVGDGQPLSRNTQRAFLVGEGSQIAKDPSKGFERNYRFLVSRGQGGDGPDLIVSAFDPTRGLVELMAWDATQGGFNYYRNVDGTEGDRGAWVWAGNSRHALEPDTRAKGPFESHPTGNIIMKELKVPWVHWASPKARVDERDFAAGDPRASHEWFTGGEVFGAYVLEDSVVKPSIERWNRRRLERTAEAGTVSDLVPIMEQLLGSRDNTHHTVNLASSQDSSEIAKTAERITLPPTFFVDVDSLQVLGLKRPQAEFTAPSSAYRRALEEFEVVVKNFDEDRPLGPGDEQFQRPGDVHFAFVIPERAFEDVNFLDQLLKHQAVNLISRRLAACLLMVDFPNPVFSDVRASLLDRVPTEPIPAERWPTFSQELGDAIAAAADGKPEDTPERQFAALWQLGEDAWQEAADQLLEDYYEAVPAQLETAEGFASYFKLAEARRKRVREMRIDESPLLFAQSNLSTDQLRPLAMSPSGVVVSRDQAP
jgi:hypothetical protein